MNGINWGNNNPYPYMPPIQVPPARKEIDRVQGEAAVDMYAMAPNSSALLLDETAPIVWLVMTDSAGYKTKTPYDIIPHETTPKVNIEDQLASIEKRLCAIEEVMRDESDS